MSLDRDKSNFLCTIGWRNPVRFRTICRMRTRVSSELIVLFCLGTVLSLGAWASGPSKKQIQTTLAPGAWTTVPLPAQALGITAHDGVLWVAGTDELLARSDDQGRTWKIVHFQKDGQALAAVAFAGKDGWAMGSPGLELHSEDDGTRWMQMNVGAGMDVTRLVATDAQHLLAINSQGFLVSSNGGQQWLAKGVPGTNQEPAQMNPVTGIAMPDVEHAGALLDGPPASAEPGGYRQLFVSTVNGGKTWQMIQFSAAFHAISLSSDESGYMAPGLWRAKDSVKAVVFHSTDGTRWSMSSNQEPVYWCHHSTCLLSSKSGWVTWDRGTAAYWKTAAIPARANNWAAMPGVLCVIGDHLQCSLAQRVEGPPSGSASTMESGAAPARIQIAAKEMSGKCLQCNPPWYPQIDRANRISGKVVLHAIIGKNGRVRELTLLKAPSKSLAQASVQAVRGWVYAPTRLNGHPVEVDTQVTVTFTLAE